MKFYAILACNPPLLIRIGLWCISRLHLSAGGRESWLDWLWNAFTSTDMFCEINMRGKKYTLIVFENAVNTAMGVSVREKREWFGMEDWEEEWEIRRWVKKRAPENTFKFLTK